jgi:hypothetical protein
VRCVLVHFVSAVLISSSLLAFPQSESSADSELSPYLMRVQLQRSTPGNAICVLLRNDGQFHLETAHGDRTKVLEGSLPNSELLKVQRMLDNDGLPRLSQETPGSPRMTRGSEVLQISIFRTDHWQNLIFMNVNGSQTVPRSLNPLLHWLDSLHKQPHQQMNEDESKNNCQSPKKIELKQRP